jgi:1-acyl-sn-glycerol-3-phosphate acyltransferase
MKKIHSLWLWFSGGSIFLFFLLFAIVCTYLFDEKTYDNRLKAILRFILKVIGIKVEVEGLENLDKNKTYLFMANHVNIFDIPVIGGYLPFNVRGIEADRQFKWPLYGFAIKRLGNIPIDRVNPKKAIKSINLGAKRLQEGKSMVILPEGHRTKTGKIGQFKKLPFHMAKKGGRELVPIGLSGLYKIKRKGSWIVNPGTVKMKVGKPIPLETINTLTTEELRDYTKEKIIELIKQ